MNIFKDPILFHALGTDWPLSKFCLPCGLFLILLGGLLFWALARHTGAEWRRLSAAEAADVAANAGRTPAERIPLVHSAGAAGAEVKMSIDIDGFRRAAQRGDWTSFCLWPIAMSCCLIGVWLLLSAFLLSMPVVIWVLVSIFILGIEGIFLFMPWAALYTKIDLGVDTPTVQSHQNK